MCNFVVANYLFAIGREHHRVGHFPHFGNRIHSSLSEVHMLVRNIGGLHSIRVSVNLSVRPGQHSHFLPTITQIDPLIRILHVNIVLHVSLFQIPTGSR